MERKLIKLAIENDLFHMLKKSACQMTINDMLVNGELTNYNGKYYLTGHVDHKITLDDLVDICAEEFSHKRTGVKGKARDKKVIKSKAKRFQLETGMSYDDIANLVKYYVANYKEISGFLVMAKYFFYKQNRFKKEETSWARSIIEEWKAQEEDNKLFNTYE